LAAAGATLAVILKVPLDPAVVISALIAILYTWIGRANHALELIKVLPFQIGTHKSPSLPGPFLKNLTTVALAFSSVFGMLQQEHYYHYTNPHLPQRTA
jgi:hypothetical protein